MAKSGLSRWFSENWVDLSRPKEGGGFEPCGRPDASEGKYPKCVPASRAARMTQEEIDSAVRRKRRAESTQRREGQKPIMVSTLKKKRDLSAQTSIPAPTMSKVNVPVDMELYNRVKAEAKQKFDVYPSAYANGWLVQEYKRRGGKYKSVSKAESGIAKHGNHDQSTHGRRGRIPLTGANTPAALKAMALGGGFTYNPKRNEQRSSGVVVAPSKKTEVVFSEEEFKQRGEEIIRDYVRQKSDLLAEPNAHLGAWKDGGRIYLDVSKVMPSVSAAAEIGRAADQIGVFDLSTFTTHYRTPDSAGRMKYIPVNMTNATGYTASAAVAMADAIGKATTGVMLVPATSIDATTIPLIVERIVALAPIGTKVKKDSPTVNTVHVPTTGKRKKQRDLKLKRMRMDAAISKHESHNQQNHGRRYGRGRGMAGMVDAMGTKGGGSRAAKAGATAPGFKPLTKTAEAALAKKGVKIPPAWTNVQVSASAKGVRGCLVRGVDAAGRTQSIYSAEHTANQAAKKFARVEKAGKAAPKLDRALKRDAMTDDDAAAVLLMRELGMRPGSGKNTRAAQQAYGATTLEARHVRINQGSVNFTFVGKKGVRISVTTKDPLIRRVVEKRLKNKSGRDRLFDTSEGRTNLYIESKMGRGFTNKDLRTLKGTTMALDLVGRTRRPPRSMAEFRRMRNEVGDAVAAQLGNTRTLALGSYINPVVFAQWEAGL